MQREAALLTCDPCIESLQLNNLADALIQIEIQIQAIRQCRVSCASLLKDTYLVDVKRALIAKAGVLVCLTLK